MPKFKINDKKDTKAQKVLVDNAVINTVKAVASVTKDMNVITSLSGCSRTTARLIMLADYDLDTYRKIQKDLFNKYKGFRKPTRLVKIEKKEDSKKEDGTLVVPLEAINRICEKLDTLIRLWQ